MVEAIIKNNHIFNNIAIASRPRVIKISPKSDIAIIWLDIWDIQSRSKTKNLINRCFNIESYITTIQGANMNPVLWQPLIIKTNNSMTSKSISRISSRNYKRTQQEVPNVLLLYLYYRYMVYANNK